MDGSGLPAAASNLATLLAIFLLLAVAAFCLRRLRVRLPEAAAKLSGSINIVANRPLGGQHALVIAEVGAEKFLIGISRDGMTAIGRLSTHD